MLRRTFAAPIVASLALALSMAAGCTQIPGLFPALTGSTHATQQAITGALRVAIQLDPARSAQYTTSDVDHVDVTVSAGSLSQTVTIAKAALTSGSGSADFASLVASTWTLGAVAYDAASKSIGGSLPILVPVVAGQTATASVTLELSPDVTVPSPLPAPTDAPGSSTATSSAQSLSLSLSILNSQTVTMPVGGVVSTLAGSTSGLQDGTGAAAQFKGPQGIAVDASGSIYVADSGNNMIRKVSPSGIVTTFAGNGTAGSADGTGSNATFTAPRSLAVDAAGNVYVAEGAHRLRKITPAGAVSTLYTDASAYSVAVDAAGTLYFGSYGGVHKKTSTTESLLAGASDSVLGYVDGADSNARFNGVHGLAVDSAGNLYVAESIRIRKVSPSGVVTTLVGGGSSWSDSTGVGVGLYYAYGIAVDSSGRLFVGEYSRVRMITPSGAAITVAGGGSRGYADGTGSSARFYEARGIALDSAGRIYVADSDNHRIRLIR